MYRVGPSGRRHFPRAVKDAVIALLEEKSSDWTQAKLAAELGIHQATVSSWRGHASASREGERPFRRVQVVAERDQAQDTRVTVRSLVLPNGTRVEGLGMEELLMLVKELM